MGREGRDYWEAQLSEYWDSGLTVMCENKWFCFSVKNR